MKLSLKQYKLLGNSGLRVSPICLGTMTFGSDWGWGADKEECRRMFNLYTERGGNFFDTADVYTDGVSEIFLGEFMKGQRERCVLGTKYTSRTHPTDPNMGGNHRKNMMQSVEASLKRLQTDYIDVYWVHGWEFRTPLEEVMRGLDDLVRQGKILYVGISNAPAWKVAQANMMAAMRGWTSFVGLQVQYSLIERTPERELVPMARELGLGVLAWSPLGGGVLTGRYDRSELNKESTTAFEGTRDNFNKQVGYFTEKGFTIADEVKKIADEIACMPSQVALRWLMQESGITIPIIGADTAAQLEDNLGCLDIPFTPEHVERLNAVSNIEMGYPHSFLGSDMWKFVVDGGLNIEGWNQR